MDFTELDARELDARELDARIAESAVGWKGIQRARDGDLFGTAPGGTVQILPRYSTTWEGAGAVIEKMRERGWYTIYDNLGENGPEEGEFPHRVLMEGDEEKVGLDPEGQLRMHSASAPTAPRAVCLAALKALGVEVPQ